MESAIRHLVAREYEQGLIHLVPAIDKTASRRWPKAKVGERFRSFIDDDDALLTLLATGSVITGLTVDGQTIGGVLYKLMRTTIAHEGELDSRLEFAETGELLLGRDKWTLPVTFIWAMCVLVIVAPENEAEHIGPAFRVSLLGRGRAIDDLWGQADAVRAEAMAQFFRDP